MKKKIWEVLYCYHPLFLLVSDNEPCQQEARNLSDKLFYIKILKFAPVKQLSDKQEWPTRLLENYTWFFNINDWF